MFLPKHCLVLSINLFEYIVQHVPPHRTRYACTHLSPLHPLSYERPFPATDQMQTGQIAEWPIHLDASIKVCQDVSIKSCQSGRRLEKLNVVENGTDRDCVSQLHIYPEVAGMVSGLQEWTKVVRWFGSDMSKGEA